MADENTAQEMAQKIQELEDMLGDMRVVIGARRTILSNAEKTLQQFQDSLSAVLMEDDHAARKARKEDFSI